MSDNSDTPSIYTYDCGEYGTEEECMQEDKDRYYMWLYWTRGTFNTWMVIMGFLLYSWYPARITTDNWLSKQCPTTAYTSSTLSTMYTRSTGTAEYVEVAVNGWNKTICLNAAPIKQWTAAAWVVMVTYGLGWAFWLANLIADNEGGITNMVWLGYTQALGVFAALATFTLAIVAWTSYGTRAQVLQAWSGSQTYADSTITIGLANNSYLLWRDSFGSTALPTTD